MARRNPNDPGPITSVSQCNQEFDLLKEALSLEETEDTWQNIDSRLKRFTAAVRGGACDFPDEFIKRWKETEIVRGLVSAMSTERTRLSGTALDLVGATSQLGNHWDSAVPFYVPSIIKLLGRASKIYVTRATTTLTSLIKGSKSLAFIPYLLDGISEKSLTTRIGCAEALLCCMSEATIETDSSGKSRPKPTNKEISAKRLNDIENAIKIGGRDRDPKVRAIIKSIWELYEQRWPNRAVSLVQPFTPTIKRYLGISHSSTLASSVHTASVPTGKPHVSQPLSTSHDTTQPKGPVKGHQPTGSKNASEAPASTRNLNQNTSKPVKSHSSQTSLSKSSDLATLQKAMMVPLPRDEPEPSIANGAARARVQSFRTRTPGEGSIHQAPQSGSIMKRSNSTMRAQRVPLSAQADLPAGGVNGSTRAPARVPFQSIQSTGHPAKDVPTKAHMNPLGSEPSSKAVASGSTHVPKPTFKPTRVASNTIQADPKPSSQPHPNLQTRPLPRRVAQEPGVDKVFTAPPSLNNTLNVSVRSNTHSRKVPAEPEVPIIKQTRKAFKPTKPSAKVPSGTDSSSSKSTSSKIVADPKSVPAAPSNFGNVSTQKSIIAPVAIQELPEALRLPASIPLPCSPSPPPPEVLPSSALPPGSPPSSLHTPDSDPTPPPAIPPSPPKEPLLAPSTPKEPLLAPSTPKETLLAPTPKEPLLAPSTPKETLLAPTPKEPLLSPSTPKETLLAPSTPKLLPSSSSLPSQEVGGAEQGTSAALKPSIPSHSLHSSVVVSHPLKAQLKPLSSSLPNFGTPGPKICRTLPDDLIVPMSVPLPPSPNSPFPQLNLRARRTPRTKNTSRGNLSPRSRAVGNSSRSSAAVVAPTSTSDHEHQNCSPKPFAGTSQSDKEVGAGEQTAPKQIVQEGILVDFDHEDTIWLPRPPAIHDDLLQLNSALGVTAEIEEESDDDEDGPQEKRRRVGAEGELPEQTTLLSTQNAVAGLNTIPTNLPNTHILSRPLRRDPSMFHWDLPDLENTNPDDSDDKTVSCLKEQPPFLAGDVTINEGISFLGNIDAQNQSTPTPSTVPQSLQ